MWRISTSWGDRVCDSRDILVVYKSPKTHLVTTYEVRMKKNNDRCSSVTYIRKFFRNIPLFWQTHQYSPDFLLLSCLRISINDISLNYLVRRIRIRITVKQLTTKIFHLKLVLCYYFPYLQFFLFRQYKIFRYR